MKTTTSAAAGEISTIPKQEADETVSPEKDVDTPETKPEEDEVEVDEAKPEENSNVKESAEASDDGDDFVALKQLRNRNNRVAIVILSLGLITTAIALMVVGCRLRTMRRRLRKGRAINSNEADYLINGMYLWEERLISERESMNRTESEMFVHAQVACATFQLKNFLSSTGLIVIR